MVELEKSLYFSEQELALRKLNRQLRRQARERQDRIELIKNIVGLALALLFTVVVLCIYASTTDASNTYTVADETRTDGLHYSYRTDAYCEVVAITVDMIEVEYEDNIYSFYVDGVDFKVGDTIICTFTENWEVIDYELP
jgi:hypothetical protein